MKPEAVRERPGTTPRRHIEYDLLLGTLPHPILVLGDDDRVLYANSAAESFFYLSQGILKSQTQPDNKAL
jgi:two-component system nitrogen regulation sensor histidine kinase GlnL